VLAFLADIRATIKGNRAAKAEKLIYLLNAKIRGWTNYYRHVCSKRTFEYVENALFKMLWKWAKQRHPNKDSLWIRKKYFRTKQYRNWVFFAIVRSAKGDLKILDLIEPAKVKIRRHIMIRPEATPYDPQFKDYFVRRKWCKTRAPNGAISQKLKAG
jgi:RNA-directed DNA polymerase